MKLVIIESPLGSREDGSKLDLNKLGDQAEYRRNETYARRALLDSLRRGEAPFASHILYPLVLRDADPEERRMGMQAGFAWGEAVTMLDEIDGSTSVERPRRVVYVDYGITPGMLEGIEIARRQRAPVEYRKIGKNADLMSSHEADNPPASGSAFTHHPSEV